MRGLRRATVLAAAATAWLLLTAGAITAMPAATAADTTVPVAVTLVDTAGDPVVGWSVGGEYGPGEDDYTVDDTDAAGTAVLLVPPLSTVRVWTVLRADGTTEVITVDAGPAGASTTIVVPTRWAHTYRVIDPQGRPVSNATVRMDILVSTEVNDVAHGDYRMRDMWPWPVDSASGQHTPGITGIDGITETMAWYEPEPDPAVACPLSHYPEKCDMDDDGTPDGMFVEFDAFQGYPYAIGAAVPYAQWTVPGSEQITLQVPAVPVIEVAAQRPGKRTGEVVLTLRVTKAGVSGDVPVPKISLDAGAYHRYFHQNNGSSTDASGIAQLRYWNLTEPIIVSVTRTAQAAVATTVTLQPKRGAGFTTAQFNPPGKDTRSRTSLNREFVTLTNTSAAPVSLKGWTVTTKAGKRYRFGRLALLPGATVTLHTGPGRDTKTDRYWDAGRHVWAPRDTATLRKPSGAVAAVCGPNRGAGKGTCLITPPVG